MPTVNKHFCFTFNNPDIAITDVAALFTSKGFEVLYGIYQEEVGDSGTKHYQGYIELAKHATLLQLKTIHSRFHWEKRRGTREQARDYCRKPGGSNLIEIGEWIDSINGLAPSLRRVVNLAASGARINTIISEDAITYVKYRGGIDALVSHFQRQNHRAGIRNLNITWIVGASGSGKSYATWVFLREREFYRKSNTKWWSGYTGEPWVWWDDFDAAAIPFVDLLGYLDRYGLVGETKGGHVQLTYTGIIFTSVRSPFELYDDPNGELERRLRGKVVVKQRNQDILIGDTTELEPILDVDGVGRSQSI